MDPVQAGDSVGEGCVLSLPLSPRQWSRSRAAKSRPLFTLWVSLSICTHPWVRFQCLPCNSLFPSLSALISLLPCSPPISPSHHHPCTVLHQDSVNGVSSAHPILTARPPRPPGASVERRNPPATSLIKSKGTSTAGAPTIPKLAAQSVFLASADAVEAVYFGAGAGHGSRQNFPTEKQTSDPFRQAFNIEGGVGNRQIVVIHSYEVGTDKTATLETVLNFIQA